MSTVSKKLISFVQGGPLLRKHDVINFSQAKPTGLGGRVKGGGPGNNVPGGGVWDIQILQLPDMTAELR